MPRTPAPSRTLLVALLTVALTVLGAGGPSWAASEPRAGGDADPQWSAPLLPVQLARGFAPPGQPWLSGHRGIDLRAPEGSEVRAVDDGVVVWAGELAGTPVVSVQHDGGLRSTYQPVEASVTVGHVVFAGDVLGRLVGAGSHCAPASCLHLGAKRGQQGYLDPALLLGLRGPRLLPYLSASTMPSRSAGPTELAALGLSSSRPPSAPTLSRSPEARPDGTEGSVHQVISLLTSALAAVGAAAIAA